MTNVIVIRAGGQTLALGLPERGMPLILGLFEGVGADVSDGLPTLVQPPLRHNGVDGAPPEAALLPTGAFGFFGWPALSGHRDGRDWTLLFAGWGAEERPGAAVLRAVDEDAGLEIALHVAGTASGVWTMRSEVTNLARTPFALDRCMAGTMAVPRAADRLVAHDGGWGREFHAVEERLGLGAWLRESRRGRTSHDRSPTLFLREADGPAWGFHLGWSGNHVVCVDPLEDGRRLVHAGELFEPGEMRLEPGDAYASPALHWARAADLAAVAAAFRAHVRADVLRWPGGAMRPRPVTLNTWEGNHFNHDQNDLIRQAEAAAALGVERFVLDDGWFGRRDDVTSSLGDWAVDRRKYPDGLGPLVERVTALGMEFGLWFEPEMADPDSDLLRAHPDWALRVEGRPAPLSRHQLVLDLTRPEAADHVFAQMDAVLSAHPVRCIKWDMNRDLAAAAGEDGRAAAARQTRAAYALMDRLRAAHPEVEIESCASGGGRVDYGVLSRAHRVWLSDCTDALDRLAIQSGAALFLPPEVVGCHVSASPNHTTGRRHSLAFRATVAIDGHFGVELNPLELTDGEREELKDWIALHKRLRPLFHGRGALFRHPVVDGRHVHGVVGEAHAAVVVAQAGQMMRQGPDNIRVPGLPQGRWRIAALHPAEPAFTRSTRERDAVLRGEVAATADELAAVGLPLPPLRPESALVVELAAEPAK
ncbi:alpha-galactosidase [Lichenibacterium dinghuense]|uniref:alpha-galactosidase n=1 Tax=Lichenibacterium dinghuense TaxID=2895977 RepID=UPI001F26E49D|nr:alpha-galactosidase [Lichenibacterium sp. 6Y81]